MALGTTIIEMLEALKVSTKTAADLALTEWVEAEGDHEKRAHAIMEATRDAYELATQALREEHIRQVVDAKMKVYYQTGEMPA